MSGAVAQDSASLATTGVMEPHSARTCLMRLVAILAQCARYLNTGVRMGIVLMLATAVMGSLTAEMLQMSWIVVIRFITPVTVY